jgi:transketolase
MSMMGEKLTPSACEVDVMGAVSMYALALAAHAPSAILDWNNNYGHEADKCVCTHCGNYPRSFIGSEPEISELDVLGSVLGKEKCFGAVKGKVKAGAMTYFRSRPTSARVSSPTIRSQWTAASRSPRSRGSGACSALSPATASNTTWRWCAVVAPMRSPRRPDVISAGRPIVIRPSPTATSTLRQSSGREQMARLVLKPTNPERAAIVAKIRDKARAIRMHALDMVYTARLGHPGGDLSVADILATLYFGVLRVDPKAPRDPGRDRLILSKGHASGALYATLAEAGFIPLDWLSTYMKPKSLLNGHPNRNYVPGVEANTGPLGHGMPIAVGVAIAGKLDKADFRVFVITGDGELQEGSNWEAAMAAGHYKLANLALIIDRNTLQQGARVAETNDVEPLGDKFRAFGWEVVDADGHDPSALIDALTRPEGRAKPLCVIAHTIKGKGVSYMEDQVSWHHGVPTKVQLDQAMKELSLT